ncbi:MAG TPA: hypothetical protein VNI01_10965 [Elusimicrobiota bacterium]|nr:hypothetical protein [Elusimicrobiota bacterium]
MAKCFVKGTPADIRALLPAGSAVHVSVDTFYRDKEAFALVSCSPAGDGERGHPSEACARALRELFAGRVIVPFAEFRDDEASEAPLF